MATKNSKIEILLSAKDTGLQTALKRAQVEVRGFGLSVAGAAVPFKSLISSAMSLSTTLAGIGAVGVAGIALIGRSMLREAAAADTAVFNLQSSIQAANREFKVGSAGQWGQQVKELTAELKIYSQTAVQEAATKTIDMTKRLGLSEQQMVKVIRAAANLSAGKFDLSNGVERVTAALRGEAEASEALGLTLSETYVKGWYEARGATQGAWKDLDDLQKAQIRYNILLQQSDPLLGKAAKSAGTFGGASAKLSSDISTLQTALGRAVTSNTFFIDAMGRVSAVLAGTSVDTAENAAQWRLWAKETALSIYDVATASLDVGNTVYKAWSGISGSFQAAAASATKLYAWNQRVAASLVQLASPFADVSEDVRALKADADAADASSADLFEKAGKSFDAMSTGSEKLNGVIAKMQQLRTELEKVKADAVNPVENIAKQSNLQFEQIGKRWYGVEKSIQESNQQTTKEVGVNWGNVWKDFEGKGLSAAEAVDKALDRAARDREVTLKVREVQTRATGGLIQRLAAGGKLPGYGGGDRISALLEAGEYVIRKEAVAKFGSGLFHALNNLRIPEIPRFAAGGPVGGGDSMTVNLAFSGGSSVPVTSTREQARALIREFDRMGWRSSK
jgi:hypothetical protein